MPMERVTVYGNTKEEAESKFEWEMVKKDIICYPNEKEIIDCTNDDTDYNWMIIYKPYGF